MYLQIHHTQIEKQKPLTLLSTWSLIQNLMSTFLFIFVIVVFIIIYFLQ